MIQRFIYKRIEDYFANHKGALLLTGARQVGKTFAIRQLAERFSCFVEINFVEQPQAADIFCESRSAEEILLRLSAFAKGPLQKGDTLIFFDEVQKCKEVVTAIKFLADEGSYRYALSGSLLGIELNDLRSEPVGYMEVMEMFPLDFEEFVRAVGVNDKIMEHLQEAFTDRTPVDMIIHRKLMQLFQLYLIVGGMPAAVQKYIDTNDLQHVIGEQQAILHLYKRDISQYDRNNKLYLDEIFSLIPSELNAKNKRFILKNLNENLRFLQKENSFLWLKNAGVALPVYNAEEPVAPLLLSRSRNLFKLFQNDVGLLACQYAGGIQLKILNGEANINYGAVYESAIAQELHAHGFPLYYFNSKRQGEVDFLLEQDNTITPVEVKSGKDYARHNALTNLLGNSDYRIEQAYVLCNGNVEVRGKVVYLPVYMTMFLHHRIQQESLVYKVDLSGI